MLRILLILLSLGLAWAASQTVGILVPVFLVGAAYSANRGAMNWHHTLAQVVGLLLLVGAVVAGQYGLASYLPGGVALGLGIASSGGGWRGT